MDLIVSNNTDVAQSRKRETEFNINGDFCIWRLEHFYGGPTCPLNVYDNDVST